MPKWTGDYSPNYDDCPTEDVGCAVSSRIVRFTVVGEEAVAPKVLVTDWCQQYFSHSAGALEFGADGFLYASGGEGARYDNETYDVGQFGDNPCHDPVNAGGRLRAQDVRTLADPTSLSGSVIRINKRTGKPVTTNPLYGNAKADTNAQRIVAHGFRNPFRMAFRPGTSDLYVGDVGESRYEEINHVGTGRDRLHNLGWPCFEGPQRYPGIARVPLCGSLEAADVEVPFFKYDHIEEVTYEEDCQHDTGSVSALAFAEDPGFPTGMRHGLVFGDYARNCIWYLPPTDPARSSVPDSGHPRILVEHAGTPVDLFTGADGELYYVDIGIGADYQNIGGKIHRISYDPDRPVARLALAAGSVPYGDAPLDVTFDAGDSTDPNLPDVLSYRWDLDGDGVYDTPLSEDPTITHRFTDGTQNVVVTVEVSDRPVVGEGRTDTAQLTVYPGDHPPAVTMFEPAPQHQWEVGEDFDFSGSATDPDEAQLPLESYSWAFTMQHCPGSCHSHPLLAVESTQGGSFTTIDHELPSYILARLTVTDERGLAVTVTRRVNPYTLRVVLGTSPGGLRYVVDGSARTAASAQRMIAGAKVSLTAPRRQYRNGLLWRFRSWPGRRPLSHTVVVPRQDEFVHRATFVPVRHRLTVTTSPAGLAYSALRGQRRGPLTRQVQVGYRVGVAAPRVQRYRGFRYVFVRWSDGGAASHTFRMPDDDTVRRAVYRRAGRA